MKIGDIVTLQRGFLGEKIGTRAVVYDTYSIGGSGGVSIITENGEDIGGFNADEQEDYLELKSHSTFRYNFRNVIQLSRDWDLGVFKEAFN